MKKIDLAFLIAVGLSLLGMITYTWAGFFGSNPELHTIKYQALGYSGAFALVFSILAARQMHFKSQSDTNKSLGQS